MEAINLLGYKTLPEKPRGRYGFSYFEVNRFPTATRIGLTVNWK